MTHFDLDSLGCNTYGGVVNKQEIVKISQQRVAKDAVDVGADEFEGTCCSCGRCLPMERSLCFERTHMSQGVGICEAIASEMTALGIHGRYVLGGGAMPQVLVADKVV